MGFIYKEVTGFAGFECQAGAWRSQGGCPVEIVL